MSDRNWIILASLLFLYVEESTTAADVPDEPAAARPCSGAVVAAVPSLQFSCFLTLTARATFATTKAAVENSCILKFITLAIWNSTRLSFLANTTPNTLLFRPGSGRQSSRIAMYAGTCVSATAKKMTATVMAERAGVTRDFTRKGITKHKHLSTLMNTVIRQEIRLSAPLGSAEERERIRTSDDD